MIAYKNINRGEVRCTPVFAGGQLKRRLEKYDFCRRTNFPANLITRQKGDRAELGKGRANTWFDQPSQDLVLTAEFCAWPWASVHHIVMVSRCRCASGVPKRLPHTCFVPCRYSTKRWKAKWASTGEKYRWAKFYSSNSRRMKCLNLLLSYFTFIFTFIFFIYFYIFYGSNRGDG